MDFCEEGRRRAGFSYGFTCCEINNCFPPWRKLSMATGMGASADIVGTLESVFQVVVDRHIQSHEI